MKGEKGADRLHLVVLTTTACNARCAYCFEKGVLPVVLAQSKAIEIADFIQRRYKGFPVHISWFGGEPLVNGKGIEILCSELKSRGVDYYSSMTTNGLLIDRYKKQICEEWNIKKIQITLDGIGDTYNRKKSYIDAKEDPFSKVISNIAFLLTSKIRVNIRINFETENPNDAKEIVKYLYDEFGNNEFLHIYFAHIYGEGQKMPLDMDTNPYISLYETLMHYGYVKSLSDLGIKRKNYFCGIYNEDYYVVYPDGTLYKCEHDIGNRSKAFGLIKQNEEIDLLYKKELETSATHFSFSDCMDCKYLPICQGGCPHFATYNNKSLSCIPIKNCIGELLSIFYKGGETSWK